MEKYELVKDINVLYVRAASFPEGIKTAFEKLESVVPARDDRIVFGLSWPGKDGMILYKASLEEKYPGEGKNFGFHSFAH